MPDPRDYWELQLAAKVDPGDETSVSEPADNTAAVITLGAPGVGYRRVIVFCGAFYTAAPTAQNLIIESPTGGTVKVRRPMGTTANDFRTVDGEIHGALNATITITLPAGGVAVGGRLYITARKVRERVI